MNGMDARDQLLPLDQVPGADDWRRVMPAAVPEVTYDGKIYGVPSTSTTSTASLQQDLRPYQGCRARVHRGSPGDGPSSGLGGLIAVGSRAVDGRAGHLQCLLVARGADVYHDYFHGRLRADGPDRARWRRRSGCSPSSTPITEVSGCGR